MTARRALTEDVEATDPGALYRASRADLADVEAPCAPRRALLSVIEDEPLDTDTVILRRVAPVQVSATKPASKGRRNRLVKVIAPLSAAAAFGAFAYGGMVTNAAATELVPQSEAAIAAARDTTSTSRNIASRPAPQTATTAAPQLGTSVDGLSADTVETVDTSVAQALAVAEQQRLEAEAAAAAQAAAEAAAAAAAAAAEEAAKSFLRPVDAAVNSPYGYRTSPTGGYGELHSGADMAISCGTPVAAAQSGTVVSAKYEGSYGNRIVIQHANGISTGYAHLQAFKVSAGDTVTRGQIIGLVGTTGNSTGCHLHWMGIKASGETFDPITLLS